MLGNYIITEYIHEYMGIKSHLIKINNQKEYDLLVSFCNKDNPKSNFTINTEGDWKELHNFIKKRVRKGLTKAGIGFGKDELEPKIIKYKNILEFIKKNEHQL